MNLTTAQLLAGFVRDLEAEGFEAEEVFDLLRIAAAENLRIDNLAVSAESMKGGEHS